MKRTIILLICLALLCLTACGGENTAQGTASDAASDASTVSDGVSDISDVSLVSEVSEASDVSEVSEVSDVSEEPEESEEPDEPDDEEEPDEPDEEEDPSAEEPTTAPTTPPTTASTTTAAPKDSRAKSAKGFEIVTKDGFTYVGGVLVVNKTYSIPASYNPGGLTAECSDAFYTMQAAAAKEGLSLYIASGFRSYDTQDVIYNRYVANDGRANADRYSARPGHSEHQTGLAIDLNSISESFANTAEGKWVAAHAHEYGFILRYPKEKEAQTGYMYEPWHIRYVGKKAAADITKSGLCLEEYYGITSAYA